MILSLSVLRARGARDLDKRIADFSAHHGHPPDDCSTFAQWAEVTPDVPDLIDALRYVQGGRKIAVEVAYHAAYRALPPCVDNHPSEALAVVRRWLDGEAVPAQDLTTASRASSAYGHIAGVGAVSAVAAAADLTASAEAAESRISASTDDEFIVNARHIMHIQSACAHVRAEDACNEAARSCASTERANQRADLLRLTAGA